MKKIVLLAFFVLFILWGESIYANWVTPGTCTLANATDVGASGLRVFPKNEGKKILCLKQARQVSVFTTIKQNLIIDNSNGGACTVTYTVDGLPWRGNYPIATNRWINASCYEYSRPNKDATRTVWDLYTQEYWYDISNPLCGPVSLYTRANASFQIGYLGGWTKDQLYSRIQCSDIYSGCPKEADGVTNIYSDFYILTHRSQRLDVSFGDLVANQGTQTCNLGIGEYLYDPTIPKEVSLLDDQGDNINAQSDISYFAGSRKWKLSITDPFENTDQGVSGIKSISLEIFRTKNTYGEPIIPLGICSVHETYPAKPAGNNTTDSRSVELNCGDTSGIQVAGSYELQITYADHAGNIVNTRKNINITPNRNITPRTIREGFEKGQAKICLGTTNTNICTRYSSNETIGFTNSGACPGAPGITPKFARPILPAGTEYTGTDRDIWQPAYVCGVGVVATPVTKWRNVCSFFGRWCHLQSYIDYVNTYTQQYGYPRTTYFGIKTCIESKVISSCTGGYRTSWGNTPSATIFANTADFYKYSMSIVDSYGNPIHGKSISNFVHMGTGIFLDEVSKTGPSALIFDQSNRLSTLSRTGSIGYFTLASYAGGEFGEKFSIDIQDWDASYHTIGTKTIIFGDMSKQFFNKLFTAQMRLGNNDTDIIFGQAQSLDFSLFQSDKVGGVVTNAEVNFIDNIHAIPAMGWVPNSLGYKSTSGMESHGYIQASTMDPIAATGAVGFIPELLSRFSVTAGIEATPVVRYTINTKDISYIVSEELNSSAPLSLKGGEINSIYIGGYEQSKGKGGYVNDSTKIGESLWASVRNNIIKNVALLTRNRTPNDGLLPNGIKFVRGDQELSGEVTWDTIIVEDGNITISRNFNTAKRNIGIIALHKNDATKGSIFIKPNVAFIAGTFFAEGSVQSVDNDGNKFSTSDKSRTTILSRQVVIYGGIYSRNTVGGAVLGKIGDAYMLPGAVPSNDLQDALQYDLSFLRMRNHGWDDTGWSKNYNEGHSNSVVVLKNPISIETPPIGFR